ncbi:MAG: SGNH/GDSL hydrolase family protein [Opitutaceae bacterium]|jgi:lysophospholipase L1-like esterase|nr:SGNH/GDSL hydrolase family protein [Opitutaceae bacterium]
MSKSYIMTHINRACLAPATLFLAAGLPARASRLVDNLKAGKNQTVVFYGTSLTATGKWCADLSGWLNTLDPAGKARAVVHKSGLSGRASRSGLDNLQDRVIKFKPDTVFMEFAINDAYSGPNYPPRHPDYGMTVEKSMANLARMIGMLNEALPGVEIIMQTMNPVWDSPHGSGVSASSRPELEVYYEGCRQVAKKHGLLLIDHYPNWIKLRETDPELFQAYIRDGTHPTPEGSTAITTPQIKKSLTGSAAQDAHVPQVSTPACLQWRDKKQTTDFH